VILSRITSDYFPVLLEVGGIFMCRPPFKFENMWLEVDDFCDLVKSVRDEPNVTGPSSFILAKKLNF